MQNLILSTPPGSILPRPGHYRLALTLDHTLHAVTRHEKGISGGDFCSVQLVTDTSHQQRSINRMWQRVHLHLQNLRPLLFRSLLSRVSHSCKGNVGYFSAEYNLLHILHSISDQQNTGRRRNKILHQELVTTEEVCFAFNKKQVNTP